jgi:opacity protein-like surface antigen
MKILIIVFFITISLAIYAQNQIGVNLAYGIPYFGVKLNQEKTSYKPIIDYSPKEALEFEINYKNRQARVLNYGGSLAYQYTHSHFYESIDYGKVFLFKSTDYKLHYISLKVFLEFVFGEKVKYYAQIGPMLSVLINSEMSGYKNIASTNDTTITNVKTEISDYANDNFNMIKFGFFIGAGVDYPINNNISISLSSQFQYSINSWFINTRNTFSDRGVYFKLGIIYSFPENEK